MGQNWLTMGYGLAKTQRQIDHFHVSVALTHTHLANYVIHDYYNYTADTGLYD